jgi:hypothetical protein
VVTTDAEPVVHGAGEVFAVPEGQLHDESIGPEGARVLVGRKYQLRNRPPADRRGVLPTLSLGRSLAITAPVNSANTLDARRRLSFDPRRGPDETVEWYP